MSIHGPDRGLGRVGRVFVRHAAPGLAVAAFIGWWIEPRVGLVVAAVVLVVSTTAASVPAFARTMARIFDRIAYLVGLVLGAVAMTAVFVVAIVPVAALSRLLRRDLLQPAVVGSGTSWTARPRVVPGRFVRRQYTDERDRHADRSGLRVTAAVGAVALVLLADLAIGTLWDPAASSQAPKVPGGPETIPALAGESYVTGLFTETFAAASGGYDPFLGWQLRDVAGRHLNVENGERVSLRSSVRADPVVVWFFGGSAMYGFGQRDDHTIASQVVRLGDSDGLHVEAHNFGTPAYGNWQETLLLARLLTEREPPDVVVFYDGYNDISQQLVDGPHTEPSHALARLHQAAIERPETVVGAADVRAWWADHSAATNVVRRVRDRFDDDQPAVRLTVADRRVPDDVSVPAVVRSTESLLARGRSLSARLAATYGFELQHWWQPTLYTRDPHPGEAVFFDQAENRTGAWFPITARLSTGLPSDVVDLSNALDDVAAPVYWDTVHTNEDGVAVIALAAYRSLRPLLADRSARSGDSHEQKPSSSP